MSGPMSEKAWKRIRLLLVVLGLFGFTFYFAFRTFVFDPLEGSIRSIVSVIPRNVDVFLRKTNLRDDFSTFPEPSFFAELGKSGSWDRFLRSTLYQDLQRTQKIEEKWEELRRQIDALPIDVLGDAIGKELVLVARKPENGTQISDFAAFARVSWKIKAGLGLMRYDWIRSKFAPDLKLQDEGDEIYKLSGGGLSQEVYLWRTKDMLVVGTSIYFPKKAQDLMAASGQDSFGLSAKYGDEMQRYTGQGNELESFVRLEDFVRKNFGKADWPPIPWGVGGRLAAEFVNPEAFREALSVTRFSEGIWNRTHFTLDSTPLTDFQKRLFDAQPLNTAKEIFERAKGVPAKTFLFATLACDVVDLFRAIERSLDDSQRRLLNDQIRQAGPYRDLRQFLDDFGPAFRRNLTLMLRRHDFPRIADDPPNDGSPDPAWALALSIKSPEKVAEMITYFIRNKHHFGIENLTHFDARGGFRATEFWSQLIPATGEIAVLPAGDTFYVSNSPKYLKEILQVSLGSGGAASIANEAGFEASLSEMNPNSNLFFYLNTRRYEEVLKEQIPFLAQKSFTIDYQGERVRAREKVIREKYSEYRGRAIPPEIAKRVEEAVDQEIKNLDLAMRGPGVAKIRQELENYAFWLTSFPSIMGNLNTDPNRIDLGLKIAIEWR